MPSSNTISASVFFDPVTRQIPKIYLDTKHLNGEVYIRLRSVIESGGGRITPYQDMASIWIVDPEAPNALGNPPRNTTVLYAPWLIACSRKGSFLGPEQGDWCGFRVPLKEPSPPTLAYPEHESTPAPKPKSFPVRNPVHFASEQSINRRQNTELNVGKWSSAETNEAFRYPSIAPAIPVWNMDLAGCPNPPHVNALAPLNAGGKRTYSEKELTWIIDTIQWCFNKYPDMSLNTVCEVLARKGPHRTTEGYNSRVRRDLQWFAGRAPLLAEKLHEYNDSLIVSTETSDSESHPSAPQGSAREPRDHHMLGRGFNTAPKTTRFTDEDKIAFIRFAAARPNGMEPIGIERPGDVWTQFSRMYPHHSTSSWRTWHQHWQHDLKQAVDEYRQANLR